MTDAPKLLSQEELDAAFSAFTTAAPRIHHLRAVRAHIAALEAERDAAYAHGLENAAQWHESAGRLSSWSAEIEFHEKSAAAIRALEPPDQKD